MFRFAIACHNIAVKSSLELLHIPSPLHCLTATRQVCGGDRFC
jgi:hypothetical protein